MAGNPTILWFRRDLRLADHPALFSAVERGGPVVPLFILSPEFENMGAAARWRLGQSQASLANDLEAAGSRLILRRGDPQSVLPAVVNEVGADAVYWSRAYERALTERDAGIKSNLRQDGIEAKSFNAFLLFEPWTVETGQGGPYRVYSPFWRAVRGLEVATCCSVPSKIPAPQHFPDSDLLEDWRLGADMHRGAEIVARHTKAGEAAARDRLAAFIEDAIGTYRERRDFPAEPATSGLSEYLTYGEISPRAAWHAGQKAMAEGANGAEHFLKELVWREFAWHLFFHFPKLDQENWKSDWDDFIWRDDNSQAECWRRGMTGVPFVDSAMREMYVTGRMHNRARMIAASFLTKHLLTDWRVGLRWFADCLTDWDPASNAMGWQWVAGSGPDAAPFFRVFNPELQAEKFDPKRGYRDRWIAEGRKSPHSDALSYFDAVPKSWGLSADAGYPDPVIDLAKGRGRALDTLKAMKDDNGIA